MFLNASGKNFVLVVACAIFLQSFAGMSFAVEYDALIAEFQRDDWETRFLSRQRMDVFREEGAFNSLVSLVNNSGIDWTVRIRGIKLLGELRSPKAATNLVGMFNDPFFNHECPSIKSYVAVALGNYKNDAFVVDALIRGLNDGELLVREASIQSLGNIGDSRAVPSLITLLNDNSFAVKYNAIVAMEKIGDSKALPYLKTLAESKEDSTLKNAALLAMQKILSGRH